MKVEHLIEMANQIGDFFASMPDREEAMTDISEHIRRFWEPRMRRAILESLDVPAASETMSPIVREALTRARDALMPKAAA